MPRGVGVRLPSSAPKKAENFLGFFYAYLSQEFADIFIDFFASPFVLFDEFSVCFPLRL